MIESVQVVELAAYNVNFQMYTGDLNTQSGITFFGWKNLKFAV